MGKIKCSLCLTKKQAKKLIFDPKIALRTECFDPAEKSYFTAHFSNACFKCSRPLRNCWNIKPLYGRGRRGYAQFFFLTQKSNQNTWFSATLDFSLVFRWFSAVSPTLCTILSKKSKVSCFGGFFSLVFKNQAIAWFSWSCLQSEIRIKWKSYYFFILINTLYNVHSKEDFQTYQWDISLPETYASLRLPANM